MCPSTRRVTGGAANASKTAGEAQPAGELRELPLFGVAVDWKSEPAQAAVSRFVALGGFTWKMVGDISIAQGAVECQGIGKHCTN